MDDLKIRLVLEGAEQVQTSANKAGDALGKLGKAGQQAGQQAQLSGNQMAQVSAQLQDFFIQIQGGQAPLTALLQQGSQLSTVFGGVGGALRAVGGAVSAAVTPVTLAAAAVAALGVAYLQGQAEAQAYTRAIVLSGNAAGVTVGQLQAMAAAQAQVVGTQGQAAEALAALAATGKVAGIGLNTAAEAAVRLARVGVPLEETAKKFSSLGKEPLKALIALNEAENFLTLSVYKQVKALEERGRVAEAAALAQGEYARVGIERAKQLEGRLGSLETAWKKVGDTAKEAWDYMLNVGRDKTVEVEIKAAEARAARLRTALKGDNFAGPRAFFEAATGGRDLGQQLRDEEALISRLRESIKLGEDVASVEARNAAAIKTTIKADEEAAKAVGKLAAERDRDAAALERAIGLSGTYQEDLRRLVKLREEGVDGVRISEEQYLKSICYVIKSKPIVREQLEAQAAAQKKAADALNDLLKAEQQRLDAIYKGADQVAANVLKLQEEEKALGLSVTANISLAEAIERVTIARLEEQAAKATAQNDYGTAAALRAEIEQREKLATLIDRKETRDTAKRSAEDAAREWKRTTSEIERSLTDSLMRGFENGKGFAINLRDTLVNAFKTMVLRPVIQAVISPIAGALNNWVQGLLKSGGSGGLGQLVSGAGTLFNSSWLKSMGAGITGGGAAGGTGVMGSLASFGPYAALIAAGMSMASNAYAEGFNQRNLPYTQAWLATGGIAPPTLKLDTNMLVKLGVNEKTANIITGASLWSKAFGRADPKVQGQGISGTASSDGFAGQAYADWLAKGGWFRSDKRGTDYSPISSGMDAQLDAGVKELYATAEEYAKVLGYPVSAIKGYAADFKVAWGATEAENEAALQKAMTNLGEQLASRYATQLAPLQKAGETFAATLSRLSTLQVFSNSLQTLGGVFSRLAGTSITAREHLIELAGGMDALSQQAQGFVQNYYSRDEIAGVKAKEVRAALGNAGITTDVNSREQFRSLVEAQDPNTDAGRRQLAALLALQGSFATVADYLSETGLTLGQAAAQAPTDSLMSPLLSGVSQQLQLAQQSMTAQQETRDATLQVVDAVNALTNAITSGGSPAGSRVPGYRQPEVTTAY